MPKSIPTNGQANWGTALNSHIGQLNEPTNGGDNATADGTEAKPFKTIQYVVDFITHKLDYKGVTCTIKLVDSAVSYSGAIIPENSRIKVIGNIVNLASTTIDAALPINITKFGSNTIGGTQANATQGSTIVWAPGGESHFCFGVTTSTLYLEGLILKNSNPNRKGMFIRSINSNITANKVTFGPDLGFGSSLGWGSCAIDTGGPLCRTILQLDIAFVGKFQFGIITSDAGLGGIVQLLVLRFHFLTILVFRIF